MSPSMPFLNSRHSRLQCMVRPDSFTASGRANVAAERSSICPREKTDRANDLFPRGRSRKKEIFPSSHTTTSISDEILRGLDLPRRLPGVCLLYRVHLPLLP